MAPLVFFMVALMAACGPTSSSGDNQNNTTGGQDAAVPRDGSQSGVDAMVIVDSSTDPEVCGEQTEEIALINLGDPPDMLIVLDRSGSMIMPPGMFPMPGAASKWNIMKSALDTVITARQHNIRFGLTVFPTDNDCGVDPGARVPIDIANANAIKTFLDGTSANGSTPAPQGLEEALAYYQTIPVNDAGRYVLFATDGDPNCGGNPPDVEIATGPETVAAVTALAAAGIKSFVLGFDVGFLGGALTTVLNDAALAGQVPKPGGPPHFYQANDAASLQAALDTIAGGIIVPSCSFALVERPPVPEDVTVYVNGEAVPRSTQHTNGWDYHPDDDTITFFGSYCTELESGQVTSVNFVFGCPGPVVD